MPLPSDEALLLVLKGLRAIRNDAPELENTLRQLAADMIFLDYSGNTLSDQALQDIDKFFNQILAYLPWYGAMFETRMGQLLSPSKIRHLFSIIQKTFPKTNQTFVRNLNMAHILINEKSIREYFYIDGIEKNSEAHVHRLLSEFRGLPSVKVPIGLPEHIRFEGTWVLAPQGRGKTTLLSNMLLEDMTKVQGEEATIIVFDSKGELGDNLATLGVFAKGRAYDGKLTLIEPSSLLSINPLDLGASDDHTVGLIEYIFAGMFDGEVTERQLFVLRKLIMACKEIKGGNLFTIRELLLPDEWKKYQSEISKAGELTREYFLKGMYDEPKNRETKDALYWRVDALISRIPSLEGMYRATKTKINMAYEMDNARVVVIRNSKEILSSTGCEFFSRLFIALILQAAQQRASRSNAKKLPVYVYIDEAHDVIKRDDNIATLVEQCRSQNVAMIFAHQSLTQIESDKVKSALLNCGVKIVNPDNDAEAVAKSVGQSEEALRNLTRGQFALHVRDTHSPALQITTIDKPISTWAKMSAENFREIRAEMATRFNQDAPEMPPGPRPLPPVPNHDKDIAKEW